MLLFTQDERIWKHARKVSNPGVSRVKLEERKCTNGKEWKQLGIVVCIRSFSLDITEIGQVYWTVFVISALILKANHLSNSYEK